MVSVNNEVKYKSFILYTSPESALVISLLALLLPNLSDYCSDIIAERFSSYFFVFGEFGGLGTSSVFFLLAYDFSSLGV